MWTLWWVGVGAAVGGLWIRSCAFGGVGGLFGACVFVRGRRVIRRGRASWYLHSLGTLGRGSGMVDQWMLRYSRTSSKNGFN